MSDPIGHTGHWIPVTEKLPPDNAGRDRACWVLAWFDYGPPEINEDIGGGAQVAEISCGHWRPRGGNGNFDKHVTHWMPLPSAPTSNTPAGTDTP